MSTFKCDECHYSFPNIKLKNHMKTLQDVADFFAPSVKVSTAEDDASLLCQH